MCSLYILLIPLTLLTKCSHAAKPRQGSCICPILPQQRLAYCTSLSLKLCFLWLC